LCDTEFGHESKLQAHELGLHVNPNYLSTQDLLAVEEGQNEASNGREASNGLVGPLSGRFRCHICFYVVSGRADLREHLGKHREEEARMRADRPEDFDEVDTRAPRFRLKGGKENRKRLNNGQAQEDEDGQPLKRIRLKITLGPRPTVARPSTEGEEEEEEEEEEKEEGKPSTSPSSVRPERSCKSTANTLVALSLEDEKMDLKFEDSSNGEEDEDDKPLLSRRKKTKRPSKAEAIVNGHSEVSLVSPDPEDEPLAVTKRKSAKRTSAADSGESAPDALVNEKPLLQPEANADQQALKRGRGRPRSSPSSPVKPKPAISPTKKRKKKFRLSAKKKRGVNSKNTSGQNKMRGKLEDRPQSVTLEDLLPDLRSRSSSVDGQQQQPAQGKKSVAQERAEGIVRLVTQPDRSFVCLDTGRTFENYLQIKAHQLSELDDHCRRPSIILWKAGKEPSPIAKEPLAVSVEYSSFVSSAIKVVPETSFNNLHGTLEDIHSVEAVDFRLKGGLAALGAVDKVRLNFSPEWTTKDVWTSGGWEIGTSPLSWHKYEGAGSESRPFLAAMSSLHWSEQRRFKDVFDKSLMAKGRKKSVVDPASERSKKTFLPSLLGLKRKGRNSKLTEDSNLSSAPSELTTLGGEWEKEHRFACTVCGEEFDELREVMHHKWDAHPYCLVAHVALEESLNIPPLTFLHPQLAKGAPEVKPGEESTTTFACTKCEDNPSFESVHAFHEHLLVCGGDVEWNATGKKKKKKSRGQNQQHSGDLKGRKGLKRVSYSSEEAAEKRKARIAKFERPPPSVKETGRMTRLQAEIMKKSKRKASPKKTKRKGDAAKTNGNIKKKKQTTPMSLGKAAALVARPRRSKVNYSRDVSLRQCWDDRHRSPFAKDLMDQVKREEARLQAAADKPEEIRLEENVVDEVVGEILGERPKGEAVTL